MNTAQLQKLAGSKLGTTEVLAELEAARRRGALQELRENVIRQVLTLPPEEQDPFVFDVLVEVQRRRPRSSPTPIKRSRKRVKTPNAKVVRPQLRDFITEMLQAHTGAAPSYGAIIKAVHGQHPDCKETSIGSEIYRMRDEGLLECPARSTYMLKEITAS